MILDNLADVLKEKLHVRSTTIMLYMSYIVENVPKKPNMCWIFFFAFGYILRQRMQKKIKSDCTTEKWCNWKASSAIKLGA